MIGQGKVFGIQFPIIICLVLVALFDILLVAVLVDTLSKRRKGLL